MPSMPTSSISHNLICERNAKFVTAMDDYPFVGAPNNA